MWRSYSDRAPDPPVQVQWPPPTTISLVDKFHRAILSGKLHRIRDLYNKGVPIDTYNEEGQTGLFCAAFKGSADVVALLLSLGAKPNAKCQPEGYTPVHGACYFGCTQILKLLLQAGGDLRLCDSQRRTPMDWCRLQSDSAKIQSIMNVVEGARSCVTKTKGVDLLKGIQSSISPRSNKAFVEMVKSFIPPSSRNRQDALLNLEELSSAIHSTGFGKVYFGTGERCAAVIGLPYVSELHDLQIEKDENAPSWACGKFTIFHPRQWITRRTPVTIRELNKMAGSHCVPDILITELEVRSKLHHPNLLMLLGVCQTQKCDSVSLVYERIQLGSLHSVLHDRRFSLSDKFKTEIVIQMCEALEYVHSLGIVHCALTSHAVILVNKRQAKLSCFEYSLPDGKSSEESLVRHPILTSDAHLNILRHWMAPEVLIKQRFSMRGDIYSLACIMWELCHEEIPWHDFSLSTLRKLFSDTHETLLTKNTPSKYWGRVLEIGLRVKRSDRDLEIEEILYMMNKTKQSASGSRNEIGNGFTSFRKTSADSISSSKKKFAEIENADNSYFNPKYGHLHRTTSFSSLQNNRGSVDNCFYTSTTPRRRINEMTPTRSPKTLPRQSNKTELPGILKFDYRHDFGLRAQHVIVHEELKQAVLAKKYRDEEKEKWLRGQEKEKLLREQEQEIFFREQEKRNSHTLPHQKIKPASHFLEGVPSAVVPNLSKIWKHIPVAKEGGDGDRIFSAAIKPAGHALCLQKRSQSALDISIGGATVKKLRSMRRCYSYSRMPNELREAVFQPQRYFSQPADFQRQRGPWGPFCGFQKSNLDKKKGSSGSIPIERDNPFIAQQQQRTWHSQEISRPLSPNRLNDSLGEFQSQMKSSNVLHSTPGGDKGLIDFGVRLKSVQKKLEMGEKVIMEDKIIQTDKNNNTEEEAAETTPTPTVDTASVHPCTTTSTVTATTSSSNTTSPTTSTTATTNDKKDEVLPSSSDDVVIDSSGATSSSSDGQKSFEVHKETVEGEPEDAAHTSYVIQTGKASEKHPTIRIEDNVNIIVEDDNGSELGEYDEEEPENDYLQVEGDEDKEVEEEDNNEVVLAVNIADDDWDDNANANNNNQDGKNNNDEDGSRETDMFQTCPHLPPDTEEQ